MGILSTNKFASNNVIRFFIKLSDLILRDFSWGFGTFLEFPKASVTFSRIPSILIDFEPCICQYSTMNDTEMLKQHIVDKRLTLATLMYNASSQMSKEEIEAMKADCQRLHLYANNGDLQGALEGTDQLIEQIQERLK